MSGRHHRNRFVLHEEPARHDRWLLSFADFVTLLLAVFVLLAATAWQQRSFGTVSNAIQTGFKSLGAAPPRAVVNKPQTAPAFPCNPMPCPAAELPKAVDLTTELQSALGDSIDKHEIVLQQRSDGMVITLRELGFFRSGEAKLLPEAAAKLQKIAAVLKERHDDLRVEGHSDDQPIHSRLYRSNWELSTARAMSVLALLVDQSDFPPEKISAAGYGPYRPVATNSTPEGRRNNRRIDLVVTDAASSASASASR
jgi:chemotaxis protein MotB